MPKVCFILGGFQNNGGTGRAVSVIANSLAELYDYQITTVSYTDNHIPDLYDISKKIEQKYLFDAPVSMAKAILKYGAIKKLSGIIMANNIDIIVACGAIFYPIAILAAKKCKIKCFCWEHTNPATVSDYRFQHFARKMAVKKADKYIVLTKSAEEYCINTLGVKRDKLEQIYNPVPSLAAQSNCYDISSKKIISVGRLSYPKNFGLLIDVAEKVLEKHPDWTWDIYGSGEEYESLLAKIHEKNLDGKVNLMGQVSNIYSRYCQYAFQVMTSRYEGFPMSLIEGAANRLPLISFDIETGPNEIITEGVNGYLVESENIEAMADRVERLIEDPDLRLKMSEASFRLNERFKIEEITKRWCNIC